MKDSTLVEMANLIGKAIVAEGITQVAFSRRVGVSQKHLSQVLNGQAFAAMPTLDYWAFMLDRHFEVELLEGTGR